MDAWRSFHLFYAQPEHSDQLALTAARLLRELTPQHDDWFFIRYAEGGAHLRVRIGARALPVGEAFVAQLRRECAALAADVPVSDWVRSIGQPDREGRLFAPGTVEEIDYVPEIRRYGGVHAVAENEHLFRISTGIVVRAIGLTGADNAKRARLAIDLMLMTAAAVDCCGWTPATFFYAYAAGWKDGLSVTPEMPAGGVLTGSGFASRHDAHRAFLQSGQAPNSLAAHWGVAVRDACAAFSRLAQEGRLISPIYQRAPADDAELSRSIAGMIYSQIHMMNNRLGFPPQAEILWSDSLVGHFGGDTRQIGLQQQEFRLSLGMRANPPAQDAAAAR